MNPAAVILVAVLALGVGMVITGYLYRARVHDLLLVIAGLRAELAEADEQIDTLRLGVRLIGPLTADEIMEDQ